MTLSFIYFVFFFLFFFYLLSNLLVGCHSFDVIGKLASLWPRGRLNYDILLEFILFVYPHVEKLLKMDIVDFDSLLTCLTFETVSRGYCVNSTHRENQKAWKGVRCLVMAAHSRILFLLGEQARPLRFGTTSYASPPFLFFYF